MIGRLLMWIEYLPRGFRRAWCEITGGHDNHVLGAWTGSDRASHMRLHCERCHRETRWYKVPLKNALSPED